MYDVVTFGEAMIRLSPPSFERLEQAHSLNACVGGGEMNVAVLASRLGLKSAFVTRLPKNPLGRMIFDRIREQGVDASNIVWSDSDRAGLYWVEFGAMPRASSVLYDRAGSAISKIEPGEVNWPSIFAETRLFHVSGITPALSSTAAETTKEAAAAAREAGTTVSVDLNYRSKLWSERDAQSCMTEIMHDTDILLTTEEDTMRVFKIKRDSYQDVAKDLCERFGLRAVAITLRENISVWRNRWTAIAYADGKFYDDVTYDVEIVDRIGAGDSFTAGFIYGYLQGDIQLGVRYGNAAAAIKHSMPGDLNWATLDEVKRLVEGDGLRIVR
jgi:2-dehydro-3-deoxygluconokinase